MAPLAPGSQGIKTGFCVLCLVLKCCSYDPQTRWSVAKSYVYLSSCFECSVSSPSKGSRVSRSGPSESGASPGKTWNESDPDEQQHNVRAAAMAAASRSRLEARSRADRVTASGRSPSSAGVRGSSAGPAPGSSARIFPGPYQSQFAAAAAAGAAAAGVGAVAAAGGGGGRSSSTSPSPSRGNATSASPSLQRASTVSPGRGLTRPDQSPGRGATSPPPQRLNSGSPGRSLSGRLPSSEILSPQSVPAPGQEQIMEGITGVHLRRSRTTTSTPGISPRPAAASPLRELSPRAVGVVRPSGSGSLAEMTPHMRSQLSPAELAARASEELAMASMALKYSESGREYSTGSNRAMDVPRPPTRLSRQASGQELFAPGAAFIGSSAPLTCTGTTSPPASGGGSVMVRPASGGGASSPFGEVTSPSAMPQYKSFWTQGESAMPPYVSGSSGEVQQLPMQGQSGAAALAGLESEVSAGKSTTRGESKSESKKWLPSWLSFGLGGGSAGKSRPSVDTGVSAGGTAVASGAAEGSSGVRAAASVGAAAGVAAGVGAAATLTTLASRSERKCGGNRSQIKGLVGSK